MFPCCKLNVEIPRALLCPGPIRIIQWGLTQLAGRPMIEDIGEHCNLCILGWTTGRPSGYYG